MDGCGRRVDLGDALCRGSPRLAVRGPPQFHCQCICVQGFEAVPENTFTLRVDHELKKAFTEAARANDRPSSQLLRDFMRDYVERAEHDAWFRAEIEQSLKEADDPSAEMIPHEEVLRKWKARRPSRHRSRHVA
jgi:predicted transcriptional regulator